MKITVINNNFTNSAKTNNPKLKKNSNTFEYSSRPINFNGLSFHSKPTIIKSIPEQVQEIAKTLVEKLHKKDIENIEQIFLRNQNSGKKNKFKSLTLEEIAHIYIQKLQRAKLPLIGNGIEQGLNKITGLTDLKARMYQSFLVPLCEVLDGKPKHLFIPNGIGFIGPKGAGKTSFARALGEHYALKGGYFEEINLSGDTKNDIEYIQLKFAEAKNRFEQSKNKKYTIFLFDEIEKLLNKYDFNAREITRTLLKFTNGCKDNGAIFISTVDDDYNLEPAILRMGRTDYLASIGKIEDFDIPDVINLCINKNGLFAEKEIDYPKILETIKNRKLQYKFGDIDERLANLSSRNEHTLVTTDKIIDTLIKPGPVFSEKEAKALKEFDYFIDMYND